MQVRSGTVTVTSGSPTVIGTDTTWRTGVSSGGMFLVTGDVTPYYVGEVVSDQELTLTAPYLGATKGGAFYWITTSFTPNRGYPITEPGDIDPAIVLNRAISEIDADVGSGVGGGGGATKLGQLQDVADAGVNTGDVLTRLANGSYGFQPGGTAAIAGANLGTGTGLFASKTGGTLNFRSLTASGASLSQPNANEILLTVPPPGEANTASNVGSNGTLPVFKGKSGVNLEFNGLRQGAGIALTQSGNDIVIAATGGGTTGGEVNTASNLGIGTIALFKSKVGVNLGFRTLTLDAARFQTTLSTDANTYSVSLIMPALGDLSDTAISVPTAGQVLGYSSAGKWVPVNLPSTGIASVQSDPVPALGGNLLTNGRRIIGMPGSYSGHIERPKTKTYILELACPSPRNLASATLVCGAGTVNFEILINDAVVGGMSGAAGSSILSFTPVLLAAVPIGGQVQLRVASFSADAADLAFTLSYQSA